MKFILFVLDMMHNTKLALLLIISLLLGNRSAFASFELGKDAEFIQESLLQSCFLITEGEEDKEGTKGKESTAKEDTLSDNNDRKKVRVEDTLVYEDEWIVVEDTLVYEDFDTPKRGGAKSNNLSQGEGHDDTDKDDDDSQSAVTGLTVVTYETGNDMQENDLDKEGTSVRAYPNPATSNSVIYLATEGFEDGQVSIMDLSGRVISTFGINGERTTVSGLSSGTYLVTVTNGSAIQTVRLIVQ